MMIHISRDGQQFGPYTLEDAQAHLASGSLLPNDWAMAEGGTEWRPLSEVVAGGGAPAGGGITCPKCQASLEADQVICLACGHNLDEPAPSTEEMAAAAAAAATPVSIPMPFSYEDETANRSAFVNSIGWALIIGAVLPVIADAGKWSIPLYDMWVSGKSDDPNAVAPLPYTWQTMFGCIAPMVAGIVTCIVATMMHGRDRGGVLLGLGLIIFGVGIAVPEAGRFEARAIVDDSNATPTTFLITEGETFKFRGEDINLVDLKDHVQTVRQAQPDAKVLIRGNADVLGKKSGEIITACTEAGVSRDNITRAEINAQDVKKPDFTTGTRIENGFFEQLKFNPADYPGLLILFALSWIGVMVGTKVRSFRPESLPAYILGMAGGALTFLLWFVPVGGVMPMMLAINSLSDGDYFLGGGLLLMMLLQFGAAVCCFLNQRRIRPTLMKKYSNLGATLLLTSLMVGVAPVWGKVIFDNTKAQTAVAEDRHWFVQSQLGKVYTGHDAKFQQEKLRGIPSARATFIGAIFGWLIVGVKYISWIGGLFMLIPLGIIELLCGKREPDGPAYMQ